jgi:hypothetical protein
MTITQKETNSHLPSGADTTENFLRTRHALRRFDMGLCELAPELVAALVVHLAVADDAPTARGQMEAEVRTGGAEVRGGLAELAGQ